MKKFVLFIVGLFITIIVFSQKNQDVVNIKNSSTLKGIINEHDKNKQNTIRSKNESTGGYKISENEKLTNDTEGINLNQYGGRFSSGVAIGGGGIIGFPIRLYLTPKFALEVGVYYRPTFILNNRPSADGIMFAGGTNIYFSKFYKLKKEKINLNGLSLKGGYSLSLIPESFFSLGWANESFKITKYQKSFIFELGVGVFELLADKKFNYSNGTKIQPLIYWKLHWSWYN